MNRFLTVMASLFVAMGVCGSAFGVKSKTGGSGYDGTIRRVDRATMIVEIGTADAPKQVTIVFAANTKYTAEGKSIGNADLDVGQHVTVSVVDNVAKHVDVKRAEKTDKTEDPKKKK